MSVLRVPSPAKINPTLSVGRRRTDGYHDVFTVLQAISLFDTLEFSPSVTFEVVCNVEGLSGKANLVSKAVSLMREFVEIPPVRITITKQIPVLAGLGGGSSNVGAALHGLQLFFDLPIGSKEILDVASACGSDCPFFAMRIARGIGENQGESMTPLEPIPETPIVLAKPRIGCDSAEQYRRLRRNEESSLSREADGWLRNDFEETMPQESAELISSLREMGARHASLCGSGSAVYGVFESNLEASEAASALCKSGYWSVACETLRFVPEATWIA